MNIDGVTGSIIKDGKAAVSTLGDILGKIERITLAAMGLYAVVGKYPVVGKVIKEVFGEIGKTVAKSFPMIGKMADWAHGKLKKLAQTDIGKRLTLAIAAPVVTKALLLIGGALLLIGGALVITAGAFAKLFLSRAKAASELGDLQDALSITTNALQQLKAQADATRTSQDDLFSSIINIQKAQSEAAAGSEEMAENIKQLGFEVESFKRGNAGDIFKQISQRVREGKIGVGNFSALLAVMGKDAKRLRAAMKDGLGSGENLVPAIDPSTLRMLDEADEKLQKLWTTAKGWMAWLASGVAAGGVNLAKRGLAIKELVDTIGSLNFLKFNDAFKGVVDAETGSNLYHSGEGIDETGEKGSLTSKLEAELEQRETIRKVEEQEAAKLKEKNDERQRELDLSQMTVDQRREALTIEKESLEAQMAATKNKVEEQKLREKLIDVNKKLLSDRDTYQGQQGMAKQGDNLSRIGLIRGASASTARVVQVMNQQLAVQRNMLNIQRDELKQLQKNFEESKRFRSYLEADV